MDVADWAIQKACRLAGWRDWAQLKRSHPGPKAKVPQAVTALAKHIEDFEVAPVDPFDDFDTAISNAASCGFKNRERNRELFETLKFCLAATDDEEFPA